MRGKDEQSTAELGETRITPAYAGKRESSREKYSSIEDHPRLCGEKFDAYIPVFTMSGSPPPMRGKVDAGFSFFVDTGITPAYAGKSSVFIFFIPP